MGCELASPSLSGQQDGLGLYSSLFGNQIGPECVLNSLISIEGTDFALQERRPRTVFSVQIPLYVGLLNMLYTVSVCSG